MKYDINYSNYSVIGPYIRSYDITFQFLVPLLDFKLRKDICGTHNIHSMLNSWKKLPVLLYYDGIQ